MSGVPRRRLAGELQRQPAGVALEVEAETLGDVGLEDIARCDVVDGALDLRLDRAAGEVGRNRAVGKRGGEPRNRLRRFRGL